MYSTEQVNFRVNGTALISYFDRPPCFFICKLKKKLLEKKKSKKSKKFIDLKGSYDFCSWLARIDLTNIQFFLPTNI